MSASIDLNADLGEGFGAYELADDAALLDLVTSANVACGFHAGDPSVMRRTCEAAVGRGVRIGAHVGHRDLVGFGRRALAVSPAELRDEVLYQVGALAAFAAAAGDRVRYVKPHGALYHQVAADPGLAAALVAALVELGGAGQGLVLVGPPDGAAAGAAREAGVGYVAEGFADRAYADDGALVPRSAPGAVVGHEAAVVQGVELAASGRFGSLCLHGDSPGAVATARDLVAALRSRGVALVPFS